MENAEQYVAFIDVLGFSSLVEADFDGIVKVYDKMIESNGIRLINPCNIAWRQSAGMRVLQLRELHPIYAEKHDWFLRLHSAIMGDEPLVPPTA